MHHVVVERWSRGDSWLHARDARAKLVFSMVLIIAIATTAPQRYAAAACYAMSLAALTLASRLPLHSLTLRASLVLPFSAAFAVAGWLANDTTRSAGLLWKSYLSAYTVLLLVSSTPLVELLRALEWFRAPQLLILVAQFLYRYLFVVSEQAQHMRLAAKCRAGQGNRSGFHSAAGALSVLFVRSYARADGIQRAMIARGFTGHFPVTAISRFTSADAAFAGAAVAVSALIRFAA